MICTFLLALAQQVNTTPTPIRTDGKLPQGYIGKVAVLPWTMADGVPDAQRMVGDTLKQVFDQAKYVEISDADTTDAWEGQLHLPKPQGSVAKANQMRAVPEAKDLLALGEAMHADLVCAGRAKWHTKSVWISLGPKTKADCTVDTILIDVKKKEVILDAKGVNADDTKKEAAWETAGALLVTPGITLFSGGPKTSHQVAAAQRAVIDSFAPWLDKLRDKPRVIEK